MFKTSVMIFILTLKEVKLQLKGFLEDLDLRELKHFHWFLQNADQSKDGFKAIKKSRLEHADRLDTVDLMVQMYTSESGVVAEKILEKMKSSKGLSSCEDKSMNFLSPKVLFCFNKKLK